MISGIIIGLYVIIGFIVFAYNSCKDRQRTYYDELGSMGCLLVSMMWPAIVPLYLITQGLDNFYGFFYNKGCK